MKNNQKRIYEMKAEIIQAVAHPIRLAVIEYLEEGEQCVCDIVSQVDAQRSNVSRHLAVMVSSGVLVSRKQGLKVMYRVKTPCVLEFLGCVNRCLLEQAQEHEHILKQL